MAITIHKLAEELGFDHKVMIAILKKRRMIAQNVKSAWSTIDNVSAAELRDDLSDEKAKRDCLNSVLQRSPKIGGDPADKLQNRPLIPRKSVRVASQHERCRLCGGIAMYAADVCYTCNTK